MENKLVSQEWYQHLIEDCRAIIVERSYNSEYEKILGKWELGDRVLQDEDKGITKALHTCAVDLRKGERDLWYCLDFRRTYPNFPNEIKKWGKNINWFGIKKELTEPSKKKIKPFPKGKFGVIYADPPWRYERETGQGVVEKKYPVLSLEEIKNYKSHNRPIQDLPAEDCILFLWATFPQLKEALEVIEAWGFEYRTLGFSWIKLNSQNNKPFFGIGSYAKSNCEVCLLATKGKPHKFVIDNSISSVIITPREEHSKKPSEVRNRISQLVGSDIPKIELFAREKVPGWESHGLEV